MRYLIKIVLISIPLLQGCSSSMEEATKDSKTIRELYHQTSSTPTLKKYHQSGQLYNDGYTRYAQDELDNHFPMIPNPTLHIFVFPHLVNNEYPVPGYTTKFKLYDKDYYALPTEVY